MAMFILGSISIILGIIMGIAAPTVPYKYSNYVAIAIMAAIDSVAGALASKIQEKFNINVFISGFFINAVIAILFTLIGESLNVDIYLAAIFVFVYRIFNNLSVIRRYFIEEATKAIEKKKRDNEEK